MRPSESHRTIPADVIVAEARGCLHVAVGAGLLAGLAFTVVCLAVAAWPLTLALILLAIIVVPIWAWLDDGRREREHQRRRQPKPPYCGHCAGNSHARCTDGCICPLGNWPPRG